MPVDLGMPGAGVVELGGVDDLDEAAVDDAGLFAGEHHTDEFLRFGESAGLHDDHIDAGVGMGEPGEVLVELADVDGAAQAAVPEGDGGVAECAGDGHGVDLDGTEVVDDGSDTAAAAAVEEMIEEGGLAGTQESGKDDDRDLPVAPARLTQRATSFALPRAPDRGPGARTRFECRTRIRAGIITAK